MKSLLIAASLFAFSATAIAQDTTSSYDQMTYEQLKAVDKKALKKDEKKAYMKALKKAKKAHKMENNPSHDKKAAAEMRKQKGKHKDKMGKKDKKKKDREEEDCDDPDRT